MAAASPTIWHPYGKMLIGDRSPASFGPLLDIRRRRAQASMALWTAWHSLLDCAWLNPCINGVGPWVALARFASDASRCARPRVWLGRQIQGEPTIGRLRHALLPGVRGTDGADTMSHLGRNTAVLRVRPSRRHSRLSPFLLRRC
jgi:hypothetical protein